MKLTCDRSVLAAAVSAAGRAAPSRSAGHPALAGVLATLDGSTLTLAGTDLDLAVRAELPVNGLEDGTALFGDPRLLADILRRLDGSTVEIVVADGVAQVAAGRSQFELRCGPIDSFPTLAVPAEATQVPAQALLRALSRATVFASSDDARPILCAVSMRATEGHLRVAATDSYRLAVADVTLDGVVPDGQERLVPARTLGELTRFADPSQPVAVAFGDRQVAFTVAAFDGGSLTVSSNLVEGTYPDYQRLVPDTASHQVVVERTALSAALGRVSQLARDTAPVRLRISAGTVELSASTQDLGEAREPVDTSYDGPGVQIAFNPQFLADSLTAVGADEVRFEITDPLKPALLRPVGEDGFLTLLMPVRLTN